MQIHVVVVVVANAIKKLKKYGSRWASAVGVARGQVEKGQPPQTDVKRGRDKLGRV